MAHRTPRIWWGVHSALVLCTACDVGVTTPSRFELERPVQLAGTWHGTRMTGWDSVNDDGCRTSVAATFTQSGTSVSGRIVDDRPASCPPALAIEFDGVVDAKWIFLTSRERPGLSPALGRIDRGRLTIDWFGDRWILDR